MATGFEMEEFDPLTGTFRPRAVPNAPGYVPIGAVPGSVPGAPPAPAAPVAAATPQRGQFSDAERALWMENMPAISKQEADIAQAQALSKELRQPMTKRMDWASQASRGLEGFGSGLADTRVAKGVKGRDEAQAGFGKILADFYRNQGKQGSDDFYKKHDKENYYGGQNE